MRRMLVVATCPRDGADYLNDTLNALDETGADLFDRKVVVSDGLSPEALRWESIMYGGPSGSRKAFWNILKVVKDSSPDSFVYIEDDVRPCANAMVRINGFKVPENLAFVSFHDMSLMKNDAPRGLYEVPLRYNGVRKDFCGSQCILFPRRSWEYLLTRDPFEMADERFWSPMSSIDCVLGYLLDQSSWRSYGCHVPSLVNHIGRVSIAHPGDEKRDRANTINFAGLDFDALSTCNFGNARLDYRKWCLSPRPVDKIDMVKR